MRSNAISLSFRLPAKVKPIRKLEDILSGCLVGDDKSREWVYKTFYGYLMGVVIRYNRDPAQAEELVNDSFMKIFKHLNTFVLPEGAEDLSKAFKGWIARIASRTVIDFLRIGKNQYRFDDINDVQAPANEATVMDKLNVSDILKLINELPQLQQIIFNMYEIEGFKHDEIATALNIPVKNSRVYLARAKDRLRVLYLTQMKGS